MQALPGHNAKCVSQSRGVNRPRCSAVNGENKEARKFRFAPCVKIGICGFEEKWNHVLTSFRNFTERRFFRRIIDVF